MPAGPRLPQEWTRTVKTQGVLSRLRWPCAQTLRGIQESFSRAIAGADDVSCSIRCKQGSKAARVVFLPHAPCVSSSLPPAAKMVCILLSAAAFVKLPEQLLSASASQKVPVKWVSSCLSGKKSTLSFAKYVQAKTISWRMMHGDSSTPWTCLAGMSFLPCRV